MVLVNESAITWKNFHRRSLISIRRAGSDRGELLSKSTNPYQGILVGEPSRGTAIPRQMMLQSEFFEAQPKRSSQSRCVKLTRHDLFVDGTYPNPNCSSSRRDILNVNRGMAFPPRLHCSVWRQPYVDRLQRPLPKFWYY